MTVGDISDIGDISGFAKFVIAPSDLWYVSSYSVVDVKRNLPILCSGVCSALSDLVNYICSPIMLFNNAALLFCEKN